MTRVETGGNATLGQDGSIFISYHSGTRSSTLEDTRAYVGEWKFQLSQLAPTMSNAASTYTASTSSESLSMQILTNLPSVVPPWASGQTALPSSGPQVSNGSVDASSTPLENRGVVIGGAVAGSILIIIILISLWFWRVKRTARMERESVFAHGPLVPYKPTTWSHDRQRKSELLREDIQNGGEQSNAILLAAIDTPNLMQQAGSGTPQSAVTSESSPHRRPTSAVFSVAPPAYDSHLN